MIAINNIDDIEKNIRNILIEQSDLSPEFIRNSLSVYGEDLDKLLEEQIYNSIHYENCLPPEAITTQNDSLILFELQSRDNDSDMSEEKDEDSISYYRSFKIYVIIYGKNGTNLANNLISRFRSQVIRDKLHDEGIYLESVSNANRINEFKNEEMWIRNDFEINISCHLNIETIIKSDESYNFNNLIFNKI